MDTVTAQLAEKVNEKTFLILPNDITINILCSLPIKTAMICRLVCRRWRDLTSTRDFVDLYMKQNSNPMIIVAKECDCALTFLDNWWEPTQTSLSVHTVPFDLVLFSHAGLVAFKQTGVVASHFIIFNPVNLENVRITLSDSLRRCEIYGVFLHPLLKEYCSLWKIQTSENYIQYKILNLGPNDPSFKTIIYPFGHRSKRKDVSPLLIGNYLYWMLQFERVENRKFIGCCDIMEYDITREEFNLIPCPVKVLCECRLSQTHLLDIDGTLSFLIILPSSSLIRITIWRLENRASQLWTSAKYKFMREIDGGWGVFRATAVVDENLALLSDKSLHVCDLKQGSMRYFWEHEYIASVLSHQMSFASLRNCKSTISIIQDGQHVYAA